MPEGFEKIKSDEHQLVLAWNDLDARWEYRLHKISYERHEAYVSHGSRAWADEIAKHYGIEVPEPEAPPAETWGVEPGQDQPQYKVILAKIPITTRLSILHEPEATRKLGNLIGEL